MFSGSIHLPPQAELFHFQKGIGRLFFRSHIFDSGQIDRTAPSLQEQKGKRSLCQLECRSRTSSCRRMKCIRCLRGRSIEGVVKPVPNPVSLIPYVNSAKGGCTRQPQPFASV